MIQVLLRSESKRIISSASAKEIADEKTIRVDIGDDKFADPTYMFDLKSFDLSIKEASELAILLVEAIKGAKAAGMGFIVKVSPHTGHVIREASTKYSVYKSALDDDLEKLQYIEEYIKDKVEGNEEEDDQEEEVVEEEPEAA